MKASHAKTLLILLIALWAGCGLLLLLVMPPWTWRLRVPPPMDLQQVRTACDSLISDPAMHGGYSPSSPPPPGALGLPDALLTLEPDSLLVTDQAVVLIWNGEIMTQHGVAVVSSVADVEGLMRGIGVCRHEQALEDRVWKFTR